MLLSFFSLSSVCGRRRLWTSLFIIQLLEVILASKAAAQEQPVIKYFTSGVINRPIDPFFSGIIDTISVIDDDACIPTGVAVTIDVTFPSIANLSIHVKPPRSALVTLVPSSVCPENTSNVVGTFVDELNNPSVDGFYDHENNCANSAAGGNIFKTRRLDDALFRSSGGDWDLEIENDIQETGILHSWGFNIKCSTEIDLCDANPSPGTFIPVTILPNKPYVIDNANGIRLDVGVCDYTGDAQQVYVDTYRSDDVSRSPGSNFPPTGVYIP